MISRSYIPEKILHDKRLTATEKLAYGAIYGFEERGKTAHFSNKALISALDVDERNVRRILQKLQALNLIEITGTQRSRVIRIVMEVPYPESDICDRLGKLSRTSVTASRTSVTASRTSVTDLTTYYNKDINKEENKEEATPHKRPHRSDFHEFSKDRILLTEENIQELLINYYHSDEVALRDDIDSADAHCQQKGTWLQGEAAIGFLRKWKKNGMEFRGGKAKAKQKPKVVFKYNEKGEWIDDNGNVID